MGLKINMTIKQNRILLPLLLMAAGIIAMPGCKVSFSFSGARIAPEVKTLSIQYFQNRASLVQPGLSQNLTDALIDKCKAQTNLGLVSEAGDVNFEGEITDYTTRPLTVSADAQAATNRFTITVKVKFTNAIEPDLSYDQSNVDLSAVEEDLSRKIIELLIEDIFNRAFVNW
jgi:hypothetical protein